MSATTQIMSLVGAVFRMSAPLILAALGGIFSERAGIINIALEGKMLMGAFFAATVAYFTVSPWLGFLAGGLAGLGMGALYGVFVISWRGNQIVTGMGLTLLAGGGIPFLSQIFFQNTGVTPEIPLSGRFIYTPIIMTWCAVVLVWGVFRYTPFGLWHKSAGENPDALETAGVSVLYVRWVSLLLSGFFAGLGGATLSICLSSSYTRNMTAGRGYMALAALIVGGWKPLPAAIACIAFGFFEVIEIFFQSESSADLETNPHVQQSLMVWHHVVDFFCSSQFIQIVPYLLTVIVIVAYVGHNKPPKCLGTAYFKKR